MCTVTVAPGDTGDAGDAGEAGDTGGRGGRGAAAGVRNCCSVATGVGEGRQLEAWYLGSHRLGIESLERAGPNQSMRDMSCRYSVAVSPKESAHLGWWVSTQPQMP